MTRAETPDTPPVLIDASRDEIEAALREELSTEQLSQLRVTMVPDPEEAALGGRRGAGPEAMLAALQYVGVAVAGGVTYDLLKTAVTILIRRLGEDRVFQRPASE